MRIKYGEGVKYAKIVESGLRRVQQEQSGTSSSLSCTGKSVYASAPQFFESVVPAIDEQICSKHGISLTSVLLNLGERLYEEHCHSTTRDKKRIGFLLSSKCVVQDAIRRSVKDAEEARKVEEVVVSVQKGIKCLCAMTKRSNFDRPSELFNNLLKTKTLEKYVFPKCGISYHFLALVENARDLVRESANEYVVPAKEEKVIEPRLQEFLDSYPILRIEVQTASKFHPVLRHPVLEVADKFFLKRRV